MNNKTLTLVLMDAPFESARTTTAFRLMDLAARQGFHLKIFAYEGAVALSISQQAAHPNAIHGHDADEENHPLPRKWITGLMSLAEANGGSVDWVNCGLCIDERGVDDSIDGTRRGTPADFWEFVQNTDNTLVIPTR